MKLQNLLLPKVGICTEEQMFFRRENGREREVSFLKEEHALQFVKHGLCRFDTYFNGLSAAKWKKYTSVGEISLCLTLKGKFEVTLTNLESASGRIAKRVADQVCICADKPQRFTFPYKLYEYRGMLAFELKALDNDSYFYGGWYEGDVKEEDLHEVRLALNICTFQREAFVLRNLAVLRSAVTDNPDSELHGRLKIYISDNGRTLPMEQLNDKWLQIVPNKNVGGAGGFTRGLMEIMHDRDRYPATHVLMMDDDIIIEPESLYRTYAMLRCRKTEYRDLSIGGAMLRMDDQKVQVESGASWNAGRLVSNKAGLVLEHLAACLENEEEEYTEYNAWWYCCMPMRLVSAKNLPLPIFIRGDDLEYGLRNIRHLALLNGVCVWHEVFENKYASYLKYYILRNLLYDNAIHFPDYSLKSFLVRLYGEALREILYYRYKNVELLCRGVDDFYRGVKFLKKTDGEKLHKEILAAGYQAVPADQLTCAAYRAQLLRQNMHPTEPKWKRVWRYLTCNGYLLPVKKASGKNIQVVSMAVCFPSNFYRQRQVLNYDPSSAKGFLTTRSHKDAYMALRRLLGVTWKSLFCYHRAMRAFRRRSGELTTEHFWKRYLGMDT